MALLDRLSKVGASVVCLLEDAAYASLCPQADAGCSDRCHRRWRDQPGRERRPMKCSRLLGVRVRQVNPVDRAPTDGVV
jgi:hypothetical protein